MRDPNRILPFYTELAKIHAEKFPDWRFGQLINNFINWLSIDPFYIEEPKMLEYFKCFANNGKPSDVLDFNKANQ